MVSNWIPDLSASSQHRYRALAEAIRDAVKSGELNAGDKLLPHREMAWKLGMTVATVARAYSIAADWGLVVSRVGHGTRVRDPGDVREVVTLREGEERSHPRFGSLVDFSLLLPTPMYDHALRRHAIDNVFVRVGRTISDRSLSGYAPDLGYQSHRDAGCQWLQSLGIEAESRDLVVTRGAQEAFLLLLSVFTQPGDAVLVEDPNYLGLSHLLRLRNHQMIPLPLDDEGVIEEAIDFKATKSGAKLIFLCPSLQNPTGITLSVERRKAIVRVARKRGLIIIENDPFAPLVDKELRLPALVTMAPERTFYLASLAKSAGPAMRVCFMRCPTSHTQGLEGAKHALTLGGAFIEAEIASEWIRTGLLDTLSSWQREEIARRWSLARRTLGDHISAGLLPAPFVYLKIPQPWRAGEFVNAARAASVICMEADRFMVGPTGAVPAVRLALSTPSTEQEVRRGLDVIAGLMAGYSPSALTRY